MLLLTVYLSSNLNTEPFKRQLCITSHAPSGWSSVGKSWSNACYMEARPPLAQSLKMNGINGVEQGALQTPKVATPSGEVFSHNKALLSLEVLLRYDTIHHTFVHCPCASSLLLSPSTNYGHAILITLTLLRPTIALPYIVLNIPTIEVLLFTMDHDLQENYYPLSCLRGRTPGS